MRAGIAIARGPRADHTSEAPPGISFLRRLERRPLLDTARLVFLGTASASPSDDRFLTSVAVQAEDRLYLLDCGAPVSTLMRRYGWAPKQISRLFLTHFHPDHSSGLMPILVQQMMEGRRDPLPIAGPPGTSRRVQALMEVGFLSPDDLPYALPLENAAIDVGYGDAEFEVRFFKTTHLAPEQLAGGAPSRSSEVVAYGMRIQTCGHQVVFSGDVGSIHDVEPALDGCTLLIHELAHVRPDDLAILAQDHAVPALVITHLHADWVGREEELKQLIGTRYRGNLWIAHDGQELILKRGVPVR